MNNNIPPSELLKLAIEQNQIPRYLYKYTKADSALKAIECGTVYFARLSEFNDEYEGFANLDVNNNLKDWAMFLEKNGVYGKDARILLDTVQRNPKQAAAIIRNVITENQNNNGFLCLASQPKNVLMWAHYADQNKGCCLEYDLLADTDVFCKIRKINYDDTTVSYNYLQNTSGAFEAMFHKSKQWEYEEEYRVISIGNPGPIKLKDGSLTRVIFGPKTPDEDKIEIVKKIKTLPYTVKTGAAVKGKTSTVFDIIDVNL